MNIIKENSINWFRVTIATNKREKREIQLFSRSFKFLENKASNYVGRIVISYKEDNL